MIRPIFLLTIILLLGACGGNQFIRGKLTYDLRPDGERPPVVWPSGKDAPRYRYLGELVGEPNFVDIGEKGRNPLMSTVNWWAGVDEAVKPLLVQRPSNGAVGDKGQIYVADSGRGAVFVFDPAAPAEEKSDRGPGRMLIWDRAAARTNFKSPVAVVPVWAGDIAVSDSTLGYVVRINPQGEPIGKIGQAQLKRPTGLAFDPARGVLYVADTVAHNIKIFDASGRLIDTFGAPGEGPGELNAPTHLAFAKGRVYVTDTLNSRVQVFDERGRYLRSFGERGLTVGNLARPKGVAVDDSGVVYVVESQFGYLLAYDEQARFLLGINGSGLKEGGFFLPGGVWTDRQRRVYVADTFNGRVVIFEFLGSGGG